MRSRFLIFFVSSIIASYLGFRNNDTDMFVAVPKTVSSPPLGPVPGGLQDVEISSKIESLARFAVDEHNKNENAFFEFVRVVKAKTQVVAGAMYYLTLEVTRESGNKQLYEAKIWEKSWLEFKELQWFKPAITPSYLD